MTVKATLSSVEYHFQISIQDTFLTFKNSKKGVQDRNSKMIFYEPVSCSTTIFHLGYFATVRTS